MLKVKKIQNKEIIEVLEQDNCTVSGKPLKYVPGQNCLDDCTAYNKPRYYKSKHY
ncbi:Uncharacterised protein [[Clostridium] sordellii]|uniref:hypothetical protein n=1 Tax=Paraclostridium sordellii TaxID=1505 RepID=UPI0005E59E0A|nr:hypothetical protein [Paeniclostridium sordellii]CEN23311.1 Uncharacterised protein [[Clostridium] sordellii] [Paeniclostridium sordellii]CEN23633.1 Uncharacterised protein [[Clostridium] sordellii] [Paeniclostridium sordellii]